MKTLWISLCLLVALTASFFITYKMQTTAKVQVPTKASETQSSVNASKIEKSTVPPVVVEKPIVKPSPVVPKQSKAATEIPEKKASLIYDILGSSTSPKVYPDSVMTKWRKDVVTLSEKYPSALYINAQTEKKVVALTFDDGPDPVNTPKIIKILHDNNVKATFFCKGDRVEACKSIIKQAYADGNVIANHSWSHKDFTTTNVTVIKSEVTLTEDAIYKVIGKKPALLRPPYGSINDNTLNFLTSLNCKSILWSTDTLDWAQHDVNNIYKNVMENVRPGEIILMHCDGGKEITVDALPQVILILKQLGYSFVTIDNLLNLPAYK